MFMNNILFDYLCCCDCHGSLSQEKNSLICNFCHRKQGQIIDQNIVCTKFHPSADLAISIKKWDEFYHKFFKKNIFDSYKREYINDYFESEYKQIIKEKKISHKVYLEIGCGPMLLGQELAKSAKLVIGIDVSLNALRIAQKSIQKRGIKNYLLILGDILNMPLKDNCIDLIYGGGVIEHFKNTQQCVNELYRILKKDGVSFNTVPYLNLGSLTYRQIWGNIPNFPILKEIAEFIHIKLLKARHMIFGYEFSFLGYTLKKIHKKAGFQTVKIDRFEVKLTFDFLPVGLLRNFCIYLAEKYPLFWPMVKVIAIK